MNIPVRKLAMLEKSMIEREEAARLQGYSTDTFDRALRQRVTDIMDKVRLI